MVGAGLSEDAHAMARALDAMHGLKVHMLSLSATGINLTIIVDAEQVGPAMRRLHATFFPPDCAAADLQAGCDKPAEEGVA